LGMFSYVYFGALVGVAQIGESLKHQRKGAASGAGSNTQS